MKVRCDEALGLLWRGGYRLRPRLRCMQSSQHEPLVRRAKQNSQVAMIPNAVKCGSHAPIG
jgi:hypothetical protein